MSVDISIIIPCFNSEHFIKKCLESVFNNTFKGSYEILCCYDPSTDKTLEIIKSLQENHSNLKVVECNSSGISISRLKGIKHAQGKYICFLDADDYYDKYYLQTVFDEIEKGYDIVNCSFFNVKGNRISKNSFVKEKELDKYESVDALLKDTYMRSFLWSKIFNKSLFDFSKIVIPKIKKPIFEDTIMLFEIFTRVSKIKTIKTPLYYYVNNSNSMTKTENPDRFDFHLAAFGLIRYLCNKDQRLINIFKKNWLRCSLSLWFDAYSSRHVLKDNIFKFYKSHSKDIKEIKKKNDFSIGKLKWENYITDCLKPLDF